MADESFSVKKIKAVLAGNPNCGKSTIFNHLTGAKQTIGNFPGVTVERYEGETQCNGVKIELIDLPGLYSTASHTDEEKVAGEYLAKEPYDVVVNVVDASNLERNLYLTLQLRELKRPMLVVLNMIDTARRRGIEIDIQKMSADLGVPVLAAVGSKGIGLKEIAEAMVSIAAAGRETAQNLPIAGQNPDSATVLETADSCGTDRMESCASCGYGTCPCAGGSQVCSRLIAVDMKRYKEIAEICSRSVRNFPVSCRTVSDRIDAVLTNRYLGIPIFLAAMYLVFQLTFTIGQYPMNWLESGFDCLGSFISGLFPSGNSSFLESLIVDGIIGGVGGVLIFLPNILLLFLAISILEDSGYLARAAVLCDRWMSKLGLPGRSIVPLLIGFGCTVPALMSTRMLNNRKERLITMFVLPLFSCGARFPIYALLIPAFFPPVWRGPLLWLIYLIGIFLAVAAAKILSIFFLKGDETAFIIELPPYHLPAFRTVGLQTFERGWEYLKKAGTVLLGVSILLWFLTSYPKVSPEIHSLFDRDRIEAEASLTGTELEERLAQLERNEDQADLSESFAGRIGRFLEPVLRPMGFDWKIGTALVGATAAKEIFVAQLGIVYSVWDDTAEEDGLSEVLRRNYTPLVGFCMMLFALIATPCAATVTMMAKESGAWKWAFIQWVSLTLLAWVVTTFVYQLGFFICR